MVFGAGLIENIPDENILANMSANAQMKNFMGISGHPNRNGNDGGRLLRACQGEGAQQKANEQAARISQENCGWIEVVP